MKKVNKLLKMRSKNNFDQRGGASARFPVPSSNVRSENNNSQRSSTSAVKYLASLGE